MMFSRKTMVGKIHLKVFVIFKYKRLVKMYMKYYLRYILPNAYELQNTNYGYVLMVIVSFRALLSVFVLLDLFCFINRIYGT